MNILKKLILKKSTDGNKSMKLCNCWHFSNYEQAEFHAHMKKVLIFEVRFVIEIEKYYIINVFISLSI